MQTVSHGAGSPMIMCQGVASWKSQPSWMNEKECNLLASMKRKLANYKWFLTDSLWNPAQSANATRSPTGHSVSSSCHQTGLQGSACPSPHLQTQPPLHHPLRLEGMHLFPEEDVEGRCMAGSLALWLVAPSAWEGAALPCPGELGEDGHWGGLHLLLSSCRHHWAEGTLWWGQASLTQTYVYPSLPAPSLWGHAVWALTVPLPYLQKIMAPSKLSDTGLNPSTTSCREHIL